MRLQIGLPPSQPVIGTCTRKPAGGRGGGIASSENVHMASVTETVFSLYDVSFCHIFPGRGPAVAQDLQNAHESLHEQVQNFKAPRVCMVFDTLHLHPDDRCGHCHNTPPSGYFIPCTSRHEMEHVVP